ncbi:MAG: response regulator [Anaerolineales bacterium]
MYIVLADHHEQPRLALDTLLKEYAEFDSVDQAVDAQGLLMLVDKNSAGLVLIDAELPGCPILDLISHIHLLEPRPSICVMSSDNTTSRLLLNAGADFFVSKVDDPAWLVAKLEEVINQSRKGKGGCA